MWTCLTPCQPPPRTSQTSQREFWNNWGLWPRVMRRFRIMWSKRVRWESRMKGHKPSSYWKQVGSLFPLICSIPVFVSTSYCVNGFKDFLFSVWHLQLKWLYIKRGKTHASVYLQCWSGWLRVLDAPSPQLSQNSYVCFPCCSRWNTHSLTFLKIYLYTYKWHKLTPAFMLTYVCLVLQIAPVENDDSYDELKRDAKTCLTLMSQGLLYTEQIPMVLITLQEVSHLYITSLT